MLSDILSRRPAASIDDVLGTMADIDQALADTDGLKWFNHLYRAVTIGVQAAAGTGGAFKDPAFLRRLDVAFANLYFDAAAAGDQNPLAAPRAWRPLFQARNDRGLARIQFALAGMNAHINRDLPVGIVATFEAMGGSPSPESPEHDDFEQVNGILETVESQVKAEFATGVIGKIDAAAGPLDDIIAMWSVRAAREAAWTSAEVLWNLRSMPPLCDAFLDSLDGATGFAGRGLLVHVTPVTA
jgi:hypothetical protein